MCVLEHTLHQSAFTLHTEKHMYDIVTCAEHVQTLLNVYALKSSPLRVSRVSRLHIGRVAVAQEVAQVTY